MYKWKTVAVISGFALVSAFAIPGEVQAAAADEHAGHHPAGADSVQAPSGPAMQREMKFMREMHDKMMNAKTAGERQALMADHMKAMQGGMDMMKKMMSMGGSMSGGKGMSADMAKHQPMMEGCMMMMQMMMQRLPSQPEGR